ncbi:MAG: hypothetical protein U5L03_08720 [Burkholderiaceae bacterium]|nr:hypothetical protein [Burkholderiaceae bacterium]
MAGAGDRRGSDRVEPRFDAVMQCTPRCGNGGLSRVAAAKELVTARRRRPPRRGRRWRLAVGPQRADSDAASNRGLADFTLIMRGSPLNMYWKRGVDRAGEHNHANNHRTADAIEVLVAQRAHDIESRGIGPAQFQLKPWLAVVEASVAGVP